MMDFYAGKNRKKSFVGLVMLLLLLTPTFYTLSRMSDVQKAVDVASNKNEALVL